MRILSFATVIVVLGVSSGCATYSQESESMRTALYNQDYQLALEKLDASPAAKSESDLVLYLMERGNIDYLAGRYSDAVRQWAKASQRIEELYTVSISNQAASLVTNDSVANYEGESHERLLLTLFSAVAYFANNEPEKAIVETRKANQLLNLLNSKADSQFSYSRDAFALYLNGLIYETKEQWDSAIVDYRNALEASKSNKTQTSPQAAEEVAESLGRIAEYRNRTDIVKSLKKDFPNVKWQKQEAIEKMGEVFVIFESGKSPLKKPSDIPLPVAGQIVRVSFPLYYDITTVTQKATVSVNGAVQGRTVVMQDIGELAKQALAARRVRDTVKMIARLTLKHQTADLAKQTLGPVAGFIANVAGAATETADTRSWTTLPDTLQVKRIAVAADKELELTIQPEYSQAVIQKIRLRPGEKKLIRIRSFE